MKLIDDEQWDRNPESILRPIIGYRTKAQAARPSDEWVERAVRFVRGFANIQEGALYHPFVDEARALLAELTPQEPVDPDVAEGWEWANAAYSNSFHKAVAHAGYMAAIKRKRAESNLVPERGDMAGEG